MTGMVVNLTLSARLNRSTFFVFVLRVAGMVCLLVMHAGLANALGPSKYGTISYALGAAGVTALLSSVGLPDGTLRFVAEYRMQQAWGELKGILFRAPQILVGTSALGMVTLGGLAALSGMKDDLGRSLFYAAALTPLVALGLWRSKASRGLDVVFGAIVPEEILLPVFVTIGCFVFTVDSAGFAALIYAISACIALVVGAWWLFYALPKQTRQMEPRYETRLWLTVSGPMTLVGVMQLTLQRSDALVLGVLTDMETTGLYIAAARVALLATVMRRVTDTVVAPMIASAFHGGKKGELRKILLHGMMWSSIGAGPLFAVGMAFPGELMSLFGPGFSDATSILRILLLGQMVGALAGPAGFALLMTGHQVAYARLTGLNAACGFVLLFFVIPAWDAIGAAWVTSAMIASLNLSALVIVHKRVIPLLSRAKSGGS